MYILHVPHFLFACIYLCMYLCHICIHVIITVSAHVCNRLVCIHVYHERSELHHHLVTMCSGHSVLAELAILEGQRSTQIAAWQHMS